MPEEKETIILDQMQILELDEIILDKDKDAALKFLEEISINLLRSVENHIASRHFRREILVWSQQS